MGTYEEITEARKTLNLPEQASMEEIKSSYRRLLTKWHPDTCSENKEICSEMTRKIVNSYRTLLAYCSQYKYSFSKEEVSKYLSAEEWWLNRFGDDPLWGKDRKPE